GGLMGAETKSREKRRWVKTHRNWKMPYAASAGTERGTTTRRKIRKLEAPSTRAASIRSFGSVMKKLRKRKIAKGSPNAVCASQIPQYPLFRCPCSRKSFRRGTSEVWIGMIMRTITTRKIVSRKGNGIQANA